MESKSSIAKGTQNQVLVYHNKNSELPSHPTITPVFLLSSCFWQMYCYSPCNWDGARGHSSKDVHI